MIRIICAEDSGVVEKATEEYIKRRRKMREKVKNISISKSDIEVCTLIHTERN